MDQFPWRLIGLKEKEKEREKTEKVKEKEEKAKESPREKDMEVTAAEEEKEEDAVAEKEEEKVGEKGYGGKGKSSGKGKGPACYICGKTAHFAAECYQNPGKGKGKGKSIRNVHGEYEQWNQDNEQWNDKWQNWNNNEGDKQSQQSTQASSSSSQPSVRMVSQARGNESVRRVMQESTVTIEEVEEDEVVDLIGMFNSYAKGSSVRMVKEGKRKQHQVKPNLEEADEDSEEGMPKKRQRESI